MVKSKLLEQVRQTCRLHHLSYRTEKTYLSWIKRYIIYYRRRHPTDMGEQEIKHYLTYLSDKAKVAPSTQNQAYSALLFLYHMLWIENIQMLEKNLVGSIYSQPQNWLLILILEKFGDITYLRQSCNTL